jgi:membrane peptidoglycan carboxypeptidase
MRLREPDFFRYAHRELVRRFGAKVVQGGGLRVKTTVDLGLQALARRAMASYLDERSDPAAGSSRSIPRPAPSGR